MTVSLHDIPPELWVEDELTRVYLEALWPLVGSPITIKVGGGCNSIKALVQEHRRQGRRNVFGLVDRDFRRPASTSWLTTADHVFVLPRLEMENYLLDWQAMATASSPPRDATYFETRGRAYAQENLLWWMVCRKVLVQYYRLVNERFPGHPPIPVADLEAARGYICNQHWWTAIGATVAAEVTNNSLTQKLQQAYAKHENQLRSDAWRNEFSGKEIFGWLRGHMGIPYSGNPLDAAEKIALWQTKNRAVSAAQDLFDLYDEIKRRLMPSTPNP